MTAKPQGDKGTYLLLIQLDRSRELTIGRLGTFTFRTGWYAYAGSAFGPGGLEARLSRHARTDKRFHWHIDYLLEYARLTQSWQTVCPARLECRWAAAIRELPAAQNPIAHFGASDCRCRGHLVYWAGRPNDCRIQKALSAASPENCDLNRSTYIQ
jgi:Uri superfamily endonuclease